VAGVAALLPAKTMNRKMRVVRLNIRVLCSNSTFPSHSAQKQLEFQSREANRLRFPIIHFTVLGLLHRSLTVGSASNRWVISPAAVVIT
jgi:hypothetical protein